MQRVFLVGVDTAPILAFKKLSEYLCSQGICIIDSLSGSDEADVVLIGMSSSLELAQKEISAAQECCKRGVSFGFYSDTFGTFRRPWFTEYRDKASFLFVVNEDEARSAKELFSNAQIVVSGNPLWGNFFFPKYSRGEVRSRLGVGEDDRMILCPAGKNLTANILHLGGVIEAVSRLDKNPSRYKVFFSKHPGDLNSIDVYGDLVKYSRSLVRVVTKEEFLGSDMIPGADVVIESASTMGIEAAC